MFTRLITYIRETRIELKKVNWPTRSQAIRSTLLVIAISIAVALVLGFFDYLYQFFLRVFIF